MGKYNFRGEKPLMNQAKQSRRRFLTKSVLTAFTASGAMKAMSDTPEPPADQKPMPDRGPQIAAELVKAFVIAGHGDLPKVEALLKQEPRLINACWDWGGGDFETALGGAAHVGRPEIARYLLAHGARLDVFAAAMLGELEIVKAALTAFPDALNVPGPHGIPLLAHAKAGGEKASATLKYLEGLKANA
jgi:hypothetical protein